MFFRILAKRTALMGWFIAAISMTTVPQAQAAQNTYFSSLGSSGCANAYASSYLNASKLIALRNVTVNTINTYIGSGTQTGFSSSRYYIMSHNPTGGSLSNGAPSAVLATFTPDSISGSGASTTAKYVGSYALTAGTSYWIVPAQNAAAFPYCFWYANDVSLLNMDAFRVDTSVSLSNTAWQRANKNGGTNPVGSSWTVSMPDGLVWQFSLEYNTATPVTASLATQSGSSTASYRTVTPLQVSVDTASKVTYYANGKVISGCRNVLSSSGVATCNWKPSVHGSYRVYAIVNPISNSYVASTTSVISIGVAARTNNR